MSKKNKKSKQLGCFLAALDLVDILNMARAAAESTDECFADFRPGEITIEFPRREDEYLDDLDSRDLTRDDIFEMMTDEELQAYDYLDGMALSVDCAGIKDDEDVAFDKDDYEAAIGAIAEFEAAVSRMVYVINTGLNEDDPVAINAEYSFNESLEWIVLLAKKYQYEESIAVARLKLKRFNRNASETAEKIEWLENSLTGANEAIEEHLNLYGYDHEEDESEDGIASSLIDDGK